MNIIKTTPIQGPEAWVGQDHADNQGWIHHLTQIDIADINNALQHLNSLGLAFPGFKKQHFPLPSLATKLGLLADELENGRGFFLLRGLPLENYSEQEVNAIYYGLGLHIGTPVGQNPRGDLLGAVENTGDLNDKHTRVYETNRYLPYHSDPSDVVALLCLRQAKQGGLSSLVSVAAIYNELLERYPQYIGIYYKFFYYAHLCEDQPSLSPLFSYHKGKLTCRYLRQYVELGHEVMNFPLSKVEIEALNLFDEIMLQEHLRLDMMMQPGDMQFANNYMVLHSRSSFEDYEELEQRRKLLRLWLKMPNARELAPEFPGRNGFPLPEWGVINEAGLK